MDIFKNFSDLFFEVWDTHFSTFGRFFNDFLAHGAPKWPQVPSIGPQGAISPLSSGEMEGLGRCQRSER